MALTTEQEMRLIAFLDQFTSDDDFAVLRKLLEVLEQPQRARSLEYITREVSAKRQELS